MRRDTDLLKIQIYADYCHSSYTVEASYFYSAVVTLGVALLVLLLENIIDVRIYFGSLAAIFVILGGYLYRNNKNYHKDLYKNDNLIAMVDSGEALPSIEEIIKNRTLENRSNKDIIEIKEILQQLNTSINQIKEKIQITP